MRKIAPDPVPALLSRRCVLRLAAVQAGALALAACGSPLADATGDIAPALSAGGPGAQDDGRPSIVAVTTRKPVRDGARRPWFGAERAGGTRAVRVNFVAPDRSLIGRVSAGVTGSWRIDDVTALGEGDPIAALADKAANRDVLIYVHGYNESFETAAVNAAELASGIGFRGTTVAFSWPSRGDLLDYGYDRESALWSRDAFQDMLEALLRNASIGRVHIVAHSMGCLLTLETLRQLWNASGNADLAAKFGAVVFAAPDIDIDLFAASLPRLGPLVRHLTVITSLDDRALAVSGRLAGGVSRVGAAERDRLEPLGVKIVDASGYGWGVIGHDVFLSNGDVRAVVRRAVDRGTQA